MCNHGIGCLRSDTVAGGHLDGMDSPPASSTPTAGDESPRIKFLCSFGGSILPRPLDGRLRYVGGDTRIVSVQRDVSYEELVARMRELFEGASVIKYQQPDEDLDALVSVVNDDDVMNMMDEYDKLGASGDGITRLRIFLFSHLENEAAGLVPSHFDADQVGTGRRYVDAINSPLDTVKSQFDASSELLGLGGFDCGIHSSLHYLNIPHPSHGQRFGDMDTPWSPAGYSPGCHTPHDTREFPTSPSSVRYHAGAGEFNERMADEYVRHSPGYQVHQYDHQSPPFVENVVWLPPGAVVQEKAGYASNVAHSHNVMEGSCICEQCRMAFQRGQPSLSGGRYLDPVWKHGQPHMEQSSGGNEYAAQFAGSCAECYRGKEAYLLNQEVKLDHGVYVKEQGEQRPFHNEAHGQERGWGIHHRPFGPGYVVDGSSLNVPIGHGNFYDGQFVPSNCINQDEARYLRTVNELGNEVFHGQQMVGGVSHGNIMGIEDCGVRYGNHPSGYGADNVYPGPQNLAPIPSLRRMAQAPTHPGPSYESPGLMVANTSPRFAKFGVNDQNQNPWGGQNGGMQQKLFGNDGSSPQDYTYDQGPKLRPNVFGHDGVPFASETLQHQPSSLHVEVHADSLPRVPSASCLLDDKVFASGATGYQQCAKMADDTDKTDRVCMEKDMLGEECRTKQSETAKEADAPSSPSSRNNQHLVFDSSGVGPAKENGSTTKLDESDAGVLCERFDISVECLSFLPGLIASMKKAVLEEAEEVKAKAEADECADVLSVPDKKKSSVHELDTSNGHAEVAIVSDDEHQISKIEPTTAEAEAVAKGLQTIKNDDLEEIRELGSGTYGAVFHGKWKGSDVAIKRIKASCFAGRPSERERLIADFWKEALLLSSLHHPNVVSFYGVVRDGPGGTLATVTEFMVNGSLKQFLQKKDRTIDRRKRLILAMDAAFGMEYLHEKNIVHFDLKCENLLVNMRDPHRPICKIGDLGLSKVKQHTLVSGGVRGTLPWMAPELLSGKSNKVSEKIDVYSFGIVMWELLTGEEPYADKRCASIIGGIVNNTLRPQIPPWCDPEWKSLMESCWSTDPTGRPSFSEISQKLRKMAAAINVK